VIDMPPPDDAPSFEWFCYFLALEKSRSLLFNKLRWGKTFTKRQLYKELGDSGSQRDMFVKKGKDLGFLKHGIIDPEKGQTKRVWGMPEEFFQVIDLLLIIKKQVGDNSTLGDQPSNDPDYDEWVKRRFYHKYLTD